ncbi:MAG: hypothetical protein II163_01950 [Ruminococcus sp.]|nr:hypothetical protein [Ruminococcus sp.]MBQ1897913.1 hypothetical protein [Ruminococcus sp.]
MTIFENRKNRMDMPFFSTLDDIDDIFGYTPYLSEYRQTRQKITPAA